MSEDIVHALGPVALLGGGEATRADLDTVLNRTEKLVAADGGARLALAAGYVPDAVIGDFDSLSAADRAQIPADRLHVVREQDSTDFDKALRAIRAPLVVAAGFLGARVDHQLAAFSTLMRHADRPCILLGATELVFLVPPVLELDLAPLDVVSLMPMAPVRGTSTGLAWPIDGLELRPGGRIGTSNQATGAVRLEVEAPALLGIVPRGALDPLMQALVPLTRARWPAAQSPRPVRG